MFGEIATKEALFRGDSEIDQIFRIFRTLGTPSEKIWPGVSTLPEFQKKTFPAWEDVKLFEGDRMPKALDSKGQDLLKVRTFPNWRFPSLHWIVNLCNHMIFSRSPTEGYY